MNLRHYWRHTRQTTRPGDYLSAGQHCFPAFLLLGLTLILFLAGCEAPRIEERFSDRVSGRWQLDIQGPPERSDQVYSHRMLIDQFDGKVVGVMLSVDEGAELPTTDVFGTFKGDAIELKRYLRGGPESSALSAGLNAGEFQGVVSADGTKMSGEVVLDKSNNVVRSWRAVRLKTQDR